MLSSVKKKRKEKNVFHLSIVCIVHTNTALLCDVVSRLQIACFHCLKTALLPMTGDETSNLLLPCDLAKTRTSHA